ncbi:spermidine resistance protein [Coemansia sp. RSA 1286]|nr:spermidine resistance protein [Coemansia sp. RSA 1286]
MAVQFSSLPKVGDAQPAVSVTDNQLQAETQKQLCTPTCSTNGTHSDGYTGAFEGPEKLLEMWFAPTAEAATCIHQDARLSDEDIDQWTASRTGLRCVPRAIWREMLDLVHCQVLSTLCNERLDSYLLSESSFFVYPHKLVLKTCGTTTLLYAIPRILEIANDFLGATGAYQLFYSRKNFMFPDQQEELHRSWEKEVTYLDAHFPEGSAYLIGKTNRDHWHVYISGPHDSACTIGAGILAQMQGQLELSEHRDAESENQSDTAVNNSTEGSPVINALSRTTSHSTISSQDSALDHRHRAPMAAGPAQSLSEDTTVEILMTGLDPERMRVMYLGAASETEGAAGGKAVEKESGISGIYPNSASDSYLFTPCGFSLNGLQGDGYYTIHVTPEPHCSYASFETNVSRDSSINLDSPEGIKRLVEQVTTVFGPRFVTVTVFKARGSGTGLGNGLFIDSAATKDAMAKNGRQQNAVGNGLGLDIAPPTFAPVDGYKSVDRVLYEFDHYWLRYGYYVKTG